MHSRHAPRFPALAATKIRLAMPHLVAAVLCAALTMLALSATAIAQSANDPNRPPYAQNARSSQHSTTTSSAASSSATPASSAAPAADAAAPRSAPDGGASPDEQSLFDDVNEARVLAGLPALHWDAHLAAAAKRHCAVMLQHDALSHQFPGEPDMQQRANDANVGYSALAENVALAATADEIHLAWMHSAGHRGNILDPKLTAVGISVLPGSRGLYAVEDFSLQVGTLSLEQQEERLRDLLGAAGIHTADDSQHTRWSDARRTCLQRDSYAGKPAMVVRFETSDLSQLPEKLQAAVKSGRYHSAAVGACDAGPAGGFTRFRLAVLLY